jgi:hypothetical protein
LKVQFHKQGSGLKRRVRGRLRGKEDARIRRRESEESNAN